MVVVVPCSITHHLEDYLATIQNTCLMNVSRSIFAHLQHPPSLQVCDHPFVYLFVCEEWFVPKVSERSMQSQAKLQNTPQINVERESEPTKTATTLNLQVITPTTSATSQAGSYSCFWSITQVTSGCCSFFPKAIFFSCFKIFWFKLI